MHRRVRRRPAVAALAIGLGLLTTGCDALPGADAKSPATVAPPAPLPAPSPDPKPLDAGALLAATPANYSGAEPAEERRRAPVTQVSDPECRQFLALKDGESARAVVTQDFTWQKDGRGSGTSTLAAYGSVNEAREVFARLRGAQFACPSFSDAGDTDSSATNVVDRPAPPEGDEALAFALARSLGKDRSTMMAEEHVVTRVGTVIVDFRKVSYDGQGIVFFPTSLMSHQVTLLVLAQR
ncbi:hypothetical protein [Streptomyces sp. NPDC096339]|uniref:hypothetical protein n=1 Tax=Streptomyces sp. NPDC096339 TaxID=3366086 RepID=UPI00381F221C